MFRRSCLAAVVFAAATVPAHAALSAGQIAFTSFNADEDGFALVALTSIAAGTTIYFTDNEWNGSAIGGGGAFNTGESYSQWASGLTNIAAGTVIRFSAVDNPTTLAASVGTLTRATVTGSTNWSLSASAETIYAYEGSSADVPTTFLAAISSGAFSVAEGQLFNTGLSVGFNATQLSTGSDYAEYNGARSGLPLFAAYLPLVSNVANWNDLGDGCYAASVPNTTAFSVSAIPEPAPVALLLAGLGVIGASARRKRG